MIADGLVIDFCRFVAVWATFLSRKDAKEEHDYESVKKIYETVTRSATRPPT